MTSKILTFKNHEVYNQIDMSGDYVRRLRVNMNYNLHDPVSFKIENFSTFKWAARLLLTQKGLQQTFL